MKIAEEDINRLIKSLILSNGKYLFNSYICKEDGSTFGFYIKKVDDEFIYFAHDVLPSYDQIYYCKLFKKEIPKNTINTYKIRKEELLCIEFHTMKKIRIENGGNNE